MTRRLILLLFALTLTACGGADSPPQPTPTTAPAGAEAARYALAAELGMGVEKVVVVTSARGEWADACLELPGAGETCERILTVGLSGLLDVPETGERFEFRMNTAGDNIRFLPGAVGAAIDALVEQKGMDPESIRLVQVERVIWPNGCLGIAGSGCMQLETPGYLITLDAGGELFAIHTDRVGSRALLADSQPAQMGEPAVVWISAGEPCVTASFNRSAALYGVCDGKPVKARYITEQRPADLQHFGERYRSFEAETPAGDIQFTGYGAFDASAAEQRMIAEWASLAYQEISGQSSGAAWGLTFSWRREGGLAGFCDNVAVYAAGYALASSCKDGSDLGLVYLASPQLASLYRWVDALGAFEQTRSDPAAADALIVQIFFAGKGGQSASEAVFAEMDGLAVDILGLLQTPQNPQELLAARETLYVYLGALARGDYTAAAALYGGSYDALAAMNPTVAEGAARALFDAACNQNGFVCTGLPAGLFDEAQVNTVEFRFIVELQTTDGARLRIGSGSDAQTRFEFRVRKTDSGYRVISLPPLAP